MHIAVVGCGHGEIDKIYEVIASIEERRGIKVGLVLCCGDFQSVRNMTDLRCMACPIKYQQMHDFHRYYSGEKQAPILTLFIGGNHEASNFLQELPYGGWVAPNIFYMGYVGVVKVGSVKIAGISGIYKGHDYLKGRHEYPPYNQGTLRSVYHYRNLDIFRLKQIKQQVDIVLSHDWPKGIHQYGNCDRLLRQKPFFRDEIESNELGSRPLYEVMESVKPSYWFSAHMHVKFAAYVSHPSINAITDDSVEPEASIKLNEASSETVEKPVTKFLALDKVLPRRQFLQIIEIETANDEISFEYDPEWLAILKSTNDLVSVKDKPCFMPGPGYLPRFDFSATSEELEEIMQIFDGDLLIKNNFQKTAPVHQPGEHPNKAIPSENPLTKEFCTKLGIVDPLRLLVSDDILSSSTSKETFDEYPEDFESQMDITMNQTWSKTEDSFNPDEIDLDDDIGDSIVTDNNDQASVAKSSSNQPNTRSKLVLPPPKAGGEDSEPDEVSLSSAREGNSFRRGGLVLPPPKNSGNEDDMEIMQSSIETTGANSTFFFLDTSGEPDVKRRRDGTL